MNPNLFVGLIPGLEPIPADHERAKTMIRSMWTDRQTGLRCHAIVMNSNGGGYVGIPEGHKLVGMDYREINHLVSECRIIELNLIDASFDTLPGGELTYSAKPREDMNEASAPWWIGFDNMATSSRGRATALAMTMLDDIRAQIGDADVESVAAERVAAEIRRGCRALAAIVKAIKTS